MSNWPFDSLEPGKYGAIVADPPWSFKSNSKARPGRNAMRHYETMRLDEIAALPVEDLAADNCALFLWITTPFLAIGAHIPIMKAWGFKPSSIAFTWVKLNPNAPTQFFQERDLHMGGGLTTRKNAEFCLLGKRGKSMRKDAGVREVIISPRREHSRKPEESRDRIERYVGPDVHVCELFARERRSGWDYWGDEIDRFAATSGDRHGKPDWRRCRMDSLPSIGLRTR